MKYLLCVLLINMLMACDTNNTSNSNDVIPSINWLDTNADTKRWYSPQQLAAGKKIYAKNCAACHGADASATPNWKQTDANGNYPPPPLNGTAHTWHHSYETLSKTIKQGGLPLGGIMPAFDRLLTEEEISTIIASFQSYWTNKTYQHWLQRQMQSGD